MNYRFSKQQPPAYYECGICGAWHPADWNDDCREDAARLYPEQMDARHGPLSWSIVDMNDLPGYAEQF